MNFEKCAIMPGFSKSGHILYGINWDGLILDSDEADYVNVSEVHNPLADNEYEELCTAVSENDNSDCYGIDIYIRAL